MKKAAIYLRVSTNDQDYARQDIDLRQLAKGFGYDIVGVYEEKGSAVADMETREQLTEMRKLTKKDVECIFVWDITRLSRKASNFIALVNEFADKGICIYFKDIKVSTLDDDGKMNGMASIYIYMLGVFAQMDAENLKAKFKSGKENALRKGHSYTNLAPFGYYLEDKHLYIKESEAVHVINAFQLYSEGKDLQYIADIFNAKQVPLKSGKTDIIWVKGTIYQLLKNTVYYGKGKLENVINKEKKETTIRYFDAPAIINKGLFDIVQERFDLNKSRSDKGRLETALLRGLLFCGLCNKPYVFANNNKKRIYRDSDVRANVNQRIGCKNGQINVEKGDKAVWSSLKHIYEYEQFIKKTQEEKEKNKLQIIENINSIEQINSKLVEIQKKINRANDAYLSDKFSLETLGKYKSDFDNESDRHNRLKDELLAQNIYLQRRIDSDYDSSTFETENPTLDEMKIICNEMIKSIHIFSELNNHTKLLKVDLINGLTYYIGFFSSKDYIIMFHESNDVYFNTTTRKGTIKGLNVDASSAFPFTFNVEISEYDIKAFIEAMDIPENRMHVN